MAFSLQTIKDRLRRRLKDITDVSNDDLYDWATDLNQLLYREMLNKDPSRFLTSQSYSVSSSPSGQALPASFRDFKEYGGGFYLVDSSGLTTKTQLPQTGIGSNQRGYYISGTDVIFTGITSATSIILYYIPVLPDITSLVGTFIVPDENKDLVTEGMALAYYKNNEDPRETTSGDRFAVLLEDFKYNLPKKPNIYTTSFSSYAS